jgi:hypothetical protein
MGSGVVGREGGRLSVRTSIPRAAFVALGSALFVAAGGLLCGAGLYVPLSLLRDAWMLPFAGMSAFTLVVSVLVSCFYLLLGLASIVFFGPALIFSLGRLLFFRRPVLEVGPEGILDRASAVGVGFVRWEEVKDVRPAVFHGQRFIAIRVRDEQTLLERQNLIKRLIMRLNRRYFTGTIANVPLLMLAIPEEELLAEIEPHLEDAARRRLAKFRERERAAASKREVARGATRSGGGEAHRVLRIAKEVVRWIAVVVLSLIYYATSGMLVLFGGLLAWNGLSPGVERDASQAHPVSGAILIIVGLLVFVFFPRLVKKLTGREVISSPFGGFWS